MGSRYIGKMVYNEVKRGIQPEIYALSAIIFTAVLLLLLLINRVPHKLRIPHK